MWQQRSKFSSATPPGSKGDVDLEIPTNRAVSLDIVRASLASELDLQAQEQEVSASAEFASTTFAQIQLGSLDDERGGTDECTYAHNAIRGINSLQ